MTTHKINYLIERLGYALDYISNRQEYLESPQRGIKKDYQKAELRRLKRIKNTLIDCQEAIRESKIDKEHLNRILDAQREAMDTLREDWRVQ